MYNIYFLTTSSDPNWQRLTEEQDLTEAAKICHKIVKTLGFYCARISAVHTSELIPKEELKLSNNHFRERTIRWNKSRTLNKGEQPC
jgi:hypothetical protein